MRKIVVATLALLLGAEVAGAKDMAAAAPQSLTFAVTRNGESIGTHTVRFVNEGDRRKVSTDISFSVKTMGVAVYRYVHHSTENWQGDRLQSLSARTDDNGNTYKVEVSRIGEQLRVNREERKPIIRAPSLEQYLPAETKAESETVPGTTLPTSLWNVRLPAQSVLINIQHGRQSRFQVSKLGQETIKTSSQSVQATHYRYAGEIRFDQWFDANGRWVKAIFTAHDGSTIDYTLQE